MEYLGLLMEEEMRTPSARSGLEVVEYVAGTKDYRDAELYDSRRYQTAAGRYKQRVMANAYKRLVGSLLGKRILDVGCGTGRGVIDFASEAALAAGSDVSRDMLCLAARKANGRTNCIFVSAYAQQLPFPDAEFDVVISLNFLHLFRPETQRQMVAEMERVVKPGGILVVEFDNALHGLCLGLYKRWFTDERGSLPSEIRYVIGAHWRVVRVHGAVFPVIWRLFYRFPRLFVPVEKIAYFPPFNRLSHRIYYKLVRLGK